MKKLVHLLILIVSCNLVAQPLNKTRLLLDCNNYELNTKKIKIKLNPKYSYFELKEIRVDVKEPFLIKISGCPKQLEIVSNSASIKSDLEKVIMSSYPKRNSLKMKIHIKDIRILNNKLPTLNPRIYISMDFYVKKPSDVFELVYSTTESIPTANYIEKPIGKLIEYIIEDFYKNNRFRNSFSLAENIKNMNEKPDGVYTSFLDFENKTPTYVFNFKIKNEPKDSLRSKFYLLDHNEKKLNKQFLYFNSEGKSFINVNQYYPKNYYVELHDLNEGYYFIYDQIYDYTQASKNSSAYGAIGGVLIAAIATAAANQRAPGLIEKVSGRLTTFSKKELRNVLGTEYEMYKSHLKSHNKEQIIKTFRVLLENEKLKNKLLIKNDIPTY